MERLANHTWQDLYEWVNESHKDFYGIRGRHYADATREVLIEWILSHFQYNEQEDVWEVAPGMEFC